jgi:hypothetical protein
MSIKAVKTLLACLFAVLAAPALAITGTNWVKDFEHPFVGLIVFFDADGQFTGRCSGSLLSPTVFLTAGHCVEGATTARVYFQQDAGANYDAALGIDPITGYPDSCAAGTDGDLCAESNELHDFADSTDSPADDVAIVILISRDRVAGIRRAADRGRAPDDRPRHGQHAVHRERVRPDPALARADRQAVRLVPRAADGPVHVREPEQHGRLLPADAGQRDGRSGTCNGDSGGPVFLGGFDSNVIVGVTSFGLNTLCRGTDFAFRIDTPEVLAWIPRTFPALSEHARRKGRVERPFSWNRPWSTSKPSSSVAARRASLSAIT